MKHVIITQPLRKNYGGILQHITLKWALNSIDIKPLRLRYFHFHGRKFAFLPKYLRNFLVRLLFFIKRENTARTINHLFQDEFITVYTHSDFKHRLANVPAFIVGSDQVWRCCQMRLFAPVQYGFLSFALPNQLSRSISYAASFGTDVWEGNLQETEECRKLLRQFKAVSVRERSGIKICKEVFGVDAVQMPDPTLLFYDRDYNKIIESEKTWGAEGSYIGAYVLDETVSNTILINQSVKCMGITLQHLMQQSSAERQRNHNPVSIAQWLRLIRDCEYFVTDSFHGCVFAIIFNKPFVCLGNEGRGNARFDTLLGTFGLEDRLITDATPEKVLQVLNTPIDWTRVNAIHDAERERGINFLKDNLTE